ncbi:MAG: hypothetical protein HZB65_04660 [Candidatus Aenigmarchaeota archaeon]|nr:hypothetical protein [Candidatus Aenigmarchaeota archaeon]
MAKLRRKTAKYRSLAAKRGKRSKNIAFQQPQRKSTLLHPANLPGDMACLKIAGALYVILGLISILSGLLMVYLSYFSVGFITAFSSILMQADIAVFMIGATSVSLGIAEFLIGYGLWKLHKWAGMMGVAMAVFSLLLSIPYIMLNVFSGVMTAGFAVALLILIYLGRKKMAGSWL